MSFGFYNTVDRRKKRFKKRDDVSKCKNGCFLFSICSQSDNNPLGVFYLKKRRQIKWLVKLLPMDNDNNNK